MAHKFFCLWKRENRNPIHILVANVQNAAHWQQRIETRLCKEQQNKTKQIHDKINTILLTKCLKKKN